MSRGLGVLQRELLYALAKSQVAVMEIAPGYRSDFVHYPMAAPAAVLDRDAQGSGLRRAARSLHARGMLEITHIGTEVSYRAYVTTRTALHMRLPYSRLDPEVEALAGTDVEQHCRGIAASIESVAKAFGVYDDARFEAIYERDAQAFARAQALGDALWETRLAAKTVVGYHGRQLAQMKVGEPVGWQHLYTRHLAHWTAIAPDPSATGA